MQHVLVTGANGFVGRAVCRLLVARGVRVRAVVRHRVADGVLPAGIEVAVVGDLTEVDQWQPLLSGIDGIIHLAARTHHVEKDGDAVLQAYRDINVAISRRIAQAAVQASVRRLVYVSSVKAIGEGGSADYVETSPCRPEDAYGRTKQEAEQTLEALLEGTATELTILRPALIYGPQARGNLARLLKLVGSGIPLPLGAVTNRRAWVHVQDFAHAAWLGLTAPEAADRTYLVASPETPSTAEMVTALAEGLDIRVKMLPFPPQLLSATLGLLGKRDEARRLCGSLTVNADRIQQELGWRPRHSWDTTLREMARDTVLPTAKAARPSARPLGIKRIFDLVCVLSAAPLVLPLSALLASLVRLTSPGPVIHWSQRVGRDNTLFWMPKFRTMRAETPQLATHLLVNSRRYITPVGNLLRKTSLDELPQLWSVLRGDMSLVGPRPALFNQDDLVDLRTNAGVHRLQPGLTGWAQVNGRDELAIPEKVDLDSQYMLRQSFGLDVRIILRTVWQAICGTGVAQADEEQQRAPQQPLRRAA